MGPRHRALTEARTGRPIEATALGCARVASAGFEKERGEKEKRILPEQGLINS